ncbi:MAG: DUF2630 family protein [Gaiellaceae bacterium]
MNSDDVHVHIDDLVAEEQALLGRGGHEGGLDPTEHERLAAIKVELDRYWDLLRQRRALAESGLDPEVARLRSEDTVEGYLQ